MIKASALIELFRQALQEKWGYIWGTAGVKWTQARQTALEKTTDRDREQGRLYGKKWIGHTVADCSGLFSWAFAKLGSKMYHGSNTMYLKWCTDKGALANGKRSDGKELKPGTAVFTWKTSNKTYSHVGLYVGDGIVIEAASTTKGVITSKVTAKQWTNWGELLDVDYDNNDSPQPVNVKPTLKRGSKGEYVTALQTALYNRGYNLGKYGIDGDFGKDTEAAVKQFQKDNGLAVDGVVGEKTWDAFEKEPVPVKHYTVHIPSLIENEANNLIKQYSGSWKTEE